MGVLPGMVLCVYRFKMEGVCGVWCVVGWMRRRRRRSCSFFVYVVVGCCYNFLKISETLKKIVPLLSGPAARETVIPTCQGYQYADTTKISYLLEFFQDDWKLE